MPIKFHLIFLLLLSVALAACDGNKDTATQNINADSAVNDNSTAPNNKTIINQVKGNFSVIVLGSGGPAAMPNGRASSGYLIMIEGKPRVLLDAGGGTYQRLAETGINIKDLDIILMTHLHVDHTSDIPAMIKTTFFHASGAGVQRVDPIKVYGPGSVPPPNPYPTSVEFLDGFYGTSGVYRYLNSFPGAINAGQLDIKGTDLPFSPMTANTLHEVYNNTGLLIESIGVKHANVPALAYRISYGGKSIVYSGDTNSETENMVTISKDTDILFYDTAIMDTVPDCTPGTGTPAFCALHTKPTRMGEVAAMANPKMLVLTHLTGFTLPNLAEIENIIEEQGFTGKIKVAKDLRVFNLMDDDD